MNWESLAEIQHYLRSFGQEHLLAFWDELDETSRSQLLQDLKEVNFPLIARLLGGEGMALPAGSDLAERAHVPAVVPLGEGTSQWQPRRSSASRNAVTGRRRWP